MQLDSHRGCPSSTPTDTVSAPALAPASTPTATRRPIFDDSPSDMPCRFTSRCSHDVAVETNEDGVQMQSWHSVRRHNLRMLRRQTRHVVLLMALMEAMRVGPMQIVYAGKQGYAPRGVDDFGIAYNVGYFISWLYVCLFMVIFVPLFSWWIPNSSIDETKPSFTMSLVTYLKHLNLVLLPLTIAICLIQHAYYTVITLIYVDARPQGTMQLPANNKKTWLVRLMLLAGVCMSLSFGYGALQILEAMDLAHIKTVEYLVIVLPVQTNLGLLFGSAMQWRVEKRIEKMRLAVMAAKAEEEEAIVGDEKQALLIEV